MPLTTFELSRLGTSVAKRLTHYNEVGCLMRANGETNWSFLKELQVGEYILMAEVHPGSLYVMANRYGIKVSRKKLDNGDVAILRVE